MGRYLGLCNYIGTPTALASSSSAIDNCLLTEWEEALLPNQDLGQDKEHYKTSSHWQQRTSVGLQDKEEQDTFYIN